MNHYESFSKANEDIIGSATSVEDIISALAKRGCTDLTSSINMAACSDFPYAGGGFCDVYRGELENGTKIAIKSLRIYDGPDADKERQKILKHAAKELYYWAKLRHNNILPLMGLALFRGYISMISQWMDNGNLTSFLRLNSGANRMCICMDICAGLRYIHEKGMVHGDLKAANVVISSHGVAMITDFGNAQLRDLTLKFTNTASHSISIRWTAPELLEVEKSGSQVSKEADVYAYGMTVLEVLSGDIPYSGLTDFQVLRLVTINRGHPPRPEIELDDKMWGVLTRCWARNPNERPSITTINMHLRALHVDCTYHSQHLGLNSSRIPEVQNYNLTKSAQAAGSSEDLLSSLDSVGNRLSSGLTKLIVGDGEELGTPPSETGSKAESGAFSHYSAISSANAARTPSPSASVIPLPMQPGPMQPGVAPPRRTGSAVAQRPGLAAAHRNEMPHPPKDRPAAAMDYLRPPANKASPQVFSMSAVATLYNADAGYRAGQETKPAVEEEKSSSTTATSTPWWGGQDESGPTPTAITFYQVSDVAPAPGGEGEGGFISLVDTFSPMPSPAPGASSSFSSTPHRRDDDDDLDDLGLGNPKKKEKKIDEPKEAAKPYELKTASSWIGRWWGKKESDTSASIKANLVEQTSPVYDKELERWVNPDAPKPEPVAMPPLPPSRTPTRVQTGSPGPSLSPLGRSGDSAPPTRPQSANSLAPPPGPASGPRRARPTLNESFGPGDDMSSPEGGSRTSMPPASLRGPPSRGSTPGGKRNIRSRYVDVFAEQPQSPST